MKKWKIFFKDDNEGISVPRAFQLYTVRSFKKQGMFRDRAPFLVKL